MSAIEDARNYIQQAERVADRVPEKGRRMTTMGEVAIAKALLAVAEALEYQGAQASAGQGWRP